MADDDGDWVCLDEIEKGLPVPSNRKKGGWLVQGRDEAGREVEICHGG